MTIIRAKKSKGLYLMFLKYKAKVKRIRRHIHKLKDVAIEYYLLLMPYVSGKKFRIRRKSWKKMYEIYKEYCIKNNYGILSPTTI